MNSFFNWLVSAGSHRVLPLEKQLTRTYGEKKDKMPEHDRSKVEDGETSQLNKKPVNFPFNEKTRRVEVWVLDTT